MTEATATDSPPATYASPPVPIILTVIIVLFFVVGLFSFCFCRCFLDNVIHTWYLRHSPTDTPTAGGASRSIEGGGGRGGGGGGLGLDPFVIQSFPTFPYSSVKDLRMEKSGLECAICLLEFEDESVLRLLGVCCHVFHRECVDLWLESHKTCPVCRRNLDKSSPEKSPTPATTSPNPIRDIRPNDAYPEEDIFIIDIKDDDNDGHRGADTVGENQAVERFSRSHSTGHSIIRARAMEEEEEEEDRHRLRLPEHLHAKLVKGHHWSTSCTNFGDYRDRTSAGCGVFGEVSEFSGGNINRV